MEGPILRNPRNRPTVLIGEGDPTIATRYAGWLEDHCHVRIAHSGTDALDQLDDTVDVVVLDHRLTDITGDEPLAPFRERGADCQIAMVHGATRSPDGVALESDADLTKPITRDDLTGVIDELLARADYHWQVNRYYTLACQRAAIEAEHSEAELRQSDEYAVLVGELVALRERLDGELADLSDDLEYETLFHDIGSESDPLRDPWS